ncbi:hypothetical protein FO519_007507 [Halicephalobus sp. NKZ332]|nr:hypothetical protein FO519_007507 [Halicephalobus sp. NKZ332]
MSTLYPDESYCKCELGSILYSKRKGNEFSAVVTDQREIAGLFGHVEYDVVITVTPTDQIVNEPRKFKAPTRFKEVSKLHNQLSTIHKQLYLKDIFPNFPQAMVFGSSAPEVTQERKKAIAYFVNFVVHNEVLCKTKVFQQFIDTFQEIMENPPPTNTESFPPSELATPVLGHLVLGGDEEEEEKPAGVISEKRPSTISGPEELSESEDRPPA